MHIDFPDGVYPTMLLPLTQEDQVDFEALDKLLDWYVAQGCTGIFAMCHSTELHCLTMAERLSIIRFVRRKMDLVLAQTGKRLPVVCAGTFSTHVERQVEEIIAVSQAGADAVVWLTNRLDPQQHGDGVFLSNGDYLLTHLPESIQLGLYECPQPYKRLISPQILTWALAQNRFRFLKDTCCDPAMLKERLALLRGTSLKLFNANTQTLLETLQQGAAGYSSCMANIHPDLYAWLCANHHRHPQEAQHLQQVLTFTTMSEFYAYPLTAKYTLSQHENVPIQVKSRILPDSDLDAYNRLIMDRLYQLTSRLRQHVSQVK